MLVAARSAVAEPCPGFIAAEFAIDPARTYTELTPTRLQRLREVFIKVAAAARLSPHLGVCPDPRPNAFATANPATVSITTGMLGVAGDSPDMLAAVLGHELGHLQRNHHLKRLQRAHQAGLVAQRNGKDAALDFFFSFSREQEMEADDVGTKRLAEAGFNPDGALQLFNAMRQKLGDRATSYLDSHPGFGERLGRLGPRVMNEHRFRQAKELQRRGEWPQLQREVVRWLALLPNFGEPWYFKGLLSDRMGRSNSVADFEKAVAYEPELGDAWVRLCVGLYREGHHWESMQCVGRLPEDARARLEAILFNGRLVVGGDPPPTGNLAVVIAPDGRTTVTNDRSLLTGWGLGDAALPPPWMAIRPRLGQRPPTPEATWPVTTPVAGFGDIRASCRPPLCSIRHDAAR